ncbi:MAG: phenylalanine--tRNA ligase subunit beta [Vicinamibacteria bacterium]
MKVPLSWLKELVPITVGAQQLADDLARVGLACDGIETDGRDAVLDLDVTTNRVDCMNVLGVAREVAVLYGLRLQPPALDFPEAGEPASAALRVEIAAPELCPRFCARVLEVRPGPSPAWLRDRLEQVGVRPINNVVDLTNYVMLELGHPSHAFDLDEVPGARLVARWGEAGESLTTLDGVLRTLPASPKVGLVAGPDGPLAVAGVMGGGPSEVSEKTRRVALEAAYWDPLSIRRAARALGMHTEASHRFERGADYACPPAATARIAHLLVRLGAGSVRPGLIDVVGAARAQRVLRLRPARLAAVLGAPVPLERADALLRGLGFEAGERAADGVPYAVPSWRGDVGREVDLIEEVGRHNGLDKIARTLPVAREAGGLSRRQARERALRDALAGSGLVEILGISIVDAREAELGGPPLLLANPLAEDQAALRTSLLRPGLLSVLRTNQRQGRRDVAAFEIGRVFQPAKVLASEPRRLGLLLAGSADRHWSARTRGVDFFDLRGAVETAFDALGLPAPAFARAAEPSWLHPGQAARVICQGQDVGFLGALHPSLLEAWDLKGPAFAAELSLDPLLDAQTPARRLRSLPRFPAAERDLSLIVDAAASSAELLAAARVAGGDRLAEAMVVDRYEGEPVPKGRVSLTLGLRFQDPARTLLSEDVDALVERVIASLRERGAEIRGV